MKLQIRGNCPTFTPEGGIYEQKKHSVKLYDESGEEIEGVEMLILDDTSHRLSIVLSLDSVQVCINPVVDSKVNVCMPLLSSG